MYNQGIDVIETKSAEVEGGQTVLTGENFYDTMKVSVNGKEVAFNHVNIHEIELKKVLVSGDTVSMTLSDTEGKVIAKSKAFQMP